MRFFLKLYVLEVIANAVVLLIGYRLHISSLGGILLLAVIWTTLNVFVLLAIASSRITQLSSGDLSKVNSAMKDMIDSKRGRKK